LIVSLLDLHPSTPGADNGGGQDKLEIFEAGTGHGALTLNLARAIHGANIAAPPTPERKNGKDYESTNEGLEAKAKKEAYDTWRAHRRAVVHTLDQSAAYSAHAQKTVQNFRQGMYFPNVDFHVGSIEEYLSGRMSTTDEAFLDHAILDLPNTHQYLDIVGKALKTNGSLVTWNPSITQINKCVMMVKMENMPFILERVIEVGPGLGGGRDWDVRMVRPRALSKSNLEPTTSESEDGFAERILESKDAASVQRPAAEDGWEMVCRPKVGIRVIGGGFIALWRKMERH
jgi:tRNA (adenine57-N1/adenine58-N1)-methyltransferase catalytic subunit